MCDRKGPNLRNPSAIAIAIAIAIDGNDATGITHERLRN